MQLCKSVFFVFPTRIRFWLHVLNFISDTYIFYLNVCAPLCDCPPHSLRTLACLTSKSTYKKMYKVIGLHTVLCVNFIHPQSFLWYLIEELRLLTDPVCLSGKSESCLKDLCMVFHSDINLFQGNTEFFLFCRPSQAHGSQRTSATNSVVLTDSIGRSERSCSEPPQSLLSKYSPSSRMCCCPSNPGSL